jgi:16S rRNA (cytidine1402-2'-O)-methyltransferase
MSGVLYVVATPIGNLKDITLRAIEVLNDCDLVVAESRERALKLLSHLSIHKPIITINSFNEERKAPGIARQISSGKTCALISGAGTPCISDPGGFVVRACYDEGIDIKAIPGPSAAAGAISISGLFTDRFLFYGFLPQKQGKKRKVLRELSNFPYPIIFYESPRKILETLQCVAVELGNRQAVVIKEMTKLFEKVTRGTMEELILELSDNDPRGEYLVIVDGAGKKG